MRTMRQWSQGDMMFVISVCIEIQQCGLCNFDFHAAVGFYQTTFLMSSRPMSLWLVGASARIPLHALPPIPCPAFLSLPRKH